MPLESSNIIYQHTLPKGIFRVATTRPDHLLYPLQFHSNILVHWKNLSVTASHDEAQVNQPKGDGVYWFWDELPINTRSFGCYTADCLPVVILGHKGGCILHAGWKGIQLEMIHQEIIKQLDPYYFFIGPSIRWKSYPVQENFRNHFPDGQFFLYHNDQLFFDLQGQMRQQIQSYYPNANYFDCGICTYENLQYHSFRREKKHFRNWNTFSLPTS